jgi:formyl-CoA transferase
MAEPEPAGSAPLPLEGVRILAIEQMQAMPFCTQLLAHLGAEVVKVEDPRSGESGRASAPRIRDADGRDVGATYLRNNLNKSSIGIDTRHPEGVALVKRLVPHYDVLAENYKPGALAKVGLGYPDLAPLHPGLVYVSVSGFGNLGATPYNHWPAYAVVAEAMGGLYGFRPEPGRAPNIGVAGALGDIGSGLFAAIGTLAALRQRDHTGQGQHVDVAMFDAMVSLMDMVPFNPSIGIADNSMRAWPGICDSFLARDGRFVVQIGREHQFERLAHAIGHPEWLADPRFASREGWRDHLDAVIRPALESWAAGRSKLEAASALADEGVVSGPCFDAPDLLRDPHVQRHRMVLPIERPDSERPLHVAGNPIKLSRSGERPARRWPLLGADTERVLRRDLGIDAAELERLRAAGAI